jgi:hypothetical protein
MLMFSIYFTSIIINRFNKFRRYKYSIEEKVGMLIFNCICKSLIIIIREFLGSYRNFLGVSDDHSDLDVNCRMHGHGISNAIARIPISCHLRGQDEWHWIWLLLAARGWPQQAVPKIPSSLKKVAIPSICTLQSVVITFAQYNVYTIYKILDSLLTLRCANYWLKISK